MLQWGLDRKRKFYKRKRQRLFRNNVKNKFKKLQGLRDYGSSNNKMWLVGEEYNTIVPRLASNINKNK